MWAVELGIAEGHQDLSRQRTVHRNSGGRRAQVGLGNSWSPVTV